MRFITSVFVVSCKIARLSMNTILNFIAFVNGAGSWT